MQHNLHSLQETIPKSIICQYKEKFNLTYYWVADAEEQARSYEQITMLTAAWTSLCNARADFGSDADTLSTEVRPNIDPGCGGGRSRTMVTASKALCFPSGPAPTRQVWKQIIHLVNHSSKSSRKLRIVYMNMVL